MVNTGLVSPFALGLARHTGQGTAGTFTIYVQLISKHWPQHGAMGRSQIRYETSRTICYAKMNNLSCTGKGLFMSSP